MSRSSAAESMPSQQETQKTKPVIKTESIKTQAEKAWEIENIRRTIDGIKNELEDIADEILQGYRLINKNQPDEEKNRINLTPKMKNEMVEDSNELRQELKTWQNKLKEKEKLTEINNRRGKELAGYDIPTDKNYLNEDQISEMTKTLQEQIPSPPTLPSVDNKPVYQQADGTTSDQMPETTAQKIFAELFPPKDREVVERLPDGTWGRNPAKDKPPESEKQRLDKENSEATMDELLDQDLVHKKEVKRLANEIRAGFGTPEKLAATLRQASVEKALAAGMAEREASARLANAGIEKYRQESQEALLNDPTRAERQAGVSEAIKAGWAERDRQITQAKMEDESDTAAQAYADQYVPKKQHGLFSRFAAKHQVVGKLARALGLTAFVGLGTASVVGGAMEMTGAGTVGEKIEQTLDEVAGFGKKVEIGIKSTAEASPMVQTAIRQEKMRADQVAAQAQSEKDKTEALVAGLPTEVAGKKIVIPAKTTSRTRTPAKEKVPDTTVAPWWNLKDTPQPMGVMPGSAPEGAGSMWGDSLTPAETKAQVDKNTEILASYFVKNPARPTTREQAGKAYTNLVELVGKKNAYGKLTSISRMTNQADQKSMDEAMRIFKAEMEN